METFGGFQVYSNPLCLENYQLTEFTKELMGEEWVKQFNQWASYSLPKYPSCYMIGNKLICHPDIISNLEKT